MMGNWRRIEIDGSVVLTKKDPCAFLIKQAKLKNKNKPGEYYLDGNKLVYHEVSVIGRYRVLGVFKDKACTQRIKIT